MKRSNIISIFVAESKSSTSQLKSYDCLSVGKVSVIVPCHLNENPVAII